MNAQHTPGPWMYREAYSRIGYMIEAEPNGFTVGEAMTAYDARLIAAAPELLRELRSALFYIESYGGEVTANYAAGGNLDAVKATIAKATGAQS